MTPIGYKLQIFESRCFLIIFRESHKVPLSTKKQFKSNVKNVGGGGGESTPHPTPPTLVGLKDSQLVKHINLADNKDFLDDDETPTRIEIVSKRNIDRSTLYSFDEPFL